MTLGSGTRFNNQSSLLGLPSWLSLWHHKDSPFNLEAYTNNDFAGTSLDKKSTTGGCQFPRSRLISWQCKKQTVVANSTTGAELMIGMAWKYSLDEIRVYTGIAKNETVHKEKGDIVERAITTTASLDVEQDSGDRPAQTRFERLSKQSYEPPLSRVNTLRSREDRFRNYSSKEESQEVGKEEKVKNSITQEEDVEIQERYGYDIEINTTSTSITTSSINITTAEPVTTVSTPITTAGVSVSNAKPNHKLAEQLQTEDQGELSIEERFEEVQKAFEKTMSWINPFVPMDKEMVEGSEKKAKGSGKEVVSKKRARKGLDEENVKRQKLEDDAEKEELRACLEIVQHDDSAININSLATKYPIVDWKTHILLEDMFYYQIIKSNGSTKYYKIFRAMLDDFDRQDLLDLYRRVKERFKTTSQEGYDRLLWGDLMTLFEPSKEDEIWKNQQDHTLISWRLYDSCGIHLLLMDTGMSIHMLVENKYPLT
nr:putative ribonuclease H-like domain-containing protein [Tanacetum cinerariifolium]